jgi:hypothetical protein
LKSWGGSLMVDRRWSLLNHYCGQAFLIARLALGRGNVEVAEAARQLLISDLEGMEDHEAIRLYLNSLGNTNWSSYKGVNDSCNQLEVLTGQLV